MGGPLTSPAELEAGKQVTSKRIVDVDRGPRGKSPWVKGETRPVVEHDQFRNLAARWCLRQRRLFARVHPP